MDLQAYRKMYEKTKPNADVNERWETRVLAHRLSGAAGAQAYINNWGTGWAVKKAVMFARKAEIEGDIPMSEIFWRRAHEIEFKEPATGSLTAQSVEPVQVKSMPTQEPTMVGTVLEPGKVVTSQPTDAPAARIFYILHEGYWGMQKHDGQKYLAFASEYGCAWQARSMKVKPSPDVDLDAAMVQVAKEVGSFVLEGEWTYLDYKRGEHRTGAQAMTANAALGHPEVLPVPTYYVFDCLESQGQDVRNLPKSERHKMALATVTLIRQRYPFIELVPVATTEYEKRGLVERMTREGREGEIWFMPHMHYVAGKHSEPYFVRTKYLQEFEADIISVAPATAEGHFIGGFEIADNEGNSLGSIGTGYSREDQQEILRRFQAGNARCVIRSQGRTETGKVWHGRFIGWAMKARWPENGKKADGFRFGSSSD